MAIHERLKSERKRLGFTQEDFAALGGVNRTAQGRYEKGLSSPGLEYMEALARVGVDVQFVITGGRGIALNQLESALIGGFRSAPDRLRRAALAVLGADDADGEHASGGATGAAISVAGQVAQNVKAKNFSQKGATFTINADKAKRSKSPK
ncbi:helix-turn-helix transcriptional regulator [Stenotrophomonas sp. B1-1]|uniref:helix-turn-helix domain-containing protein n=1 Tax=Stenotrophomonas sp. B1-1 TaxID=2710648 RepID=UPI0013DB8885|nr:helix-turn-helix transcriptional regulator [Stenotrophomonas sp. B1-1]